MHQSLPPQHVRLGAVRFRDPPDCLSPIDKLPIDLSHYITHQSFANAIIEVDRAIDNLNKSGKLFNPPTSRRDSMPMMGGARLHSEFGKITSSSFHPSSVAYAHPSDPRMGGMSQRHSIGDYEQIRPQSGSNLQNFYANQRHQPRPNEAEQMQQAKRRMAAQRERELRNYHQEQQYNRSKSTRLPPPSASAYK